MLDVRRLRLLRELALRGTIVAVAEALSYTPSAVSQQLSTLEREAGRALLERTGRRVTLTPAGHALVRHTEAVLARLEEAAAELADTGSDPTGPVRIGAFPTATRAVLPSALTLLAHRYPGLEPMLTEIDPAHVTNALRAGDVDVALLHEYDFVPSPAEPGLCTVPLYTEPMYLARHPTTPGRTGPGRPPLHQWRDTPWITATAGTLCHTMTIRACEAAGFTPTVRHRVDDFTTVLSLVAARQGVALIPHLARPAASPDVILTRLPLHRRTLIAYRDGAATHPALLAVTEALRQAVPT